MFYCFQLLFLGYLQVVGDAFLKRGHNLMNFQMLQQIREQNIFFLSNILSKSYYIAFSRQMHRSMPPLLDSACSWGARAGDPPPRLLHHRLSVPLPHRPDTPPLSFPFSSPTQLRPGLPRTPRRRCGAACPSRSPCSTHYPSWLCDLGGRQSPLGNQTHPVLNNRRE